MVQRQNEKESAGTPVATKPVSEKLKCIIAAIALAESYEGQEAHIAWIYYNRYKEEHTKGLEASVAYMGKGLWYKIWMIALGDS